MPLLAVFGVLSRADWALAKSARVSESTASKYLRLIKQERTQQAEAGQGAVAT